MHQYNKKVLFGGKLCKTLVQCILFTTCVILSQGKLKQYPGTGWNRIFSLNPSTTLEDYVEAIARVVHNKTRGSLALTLSDFKCSIENTMLGTTVNGVISVENGIVASYGDVLPSEFVPSSQRNNETDPMEATISLGVRLTSLKTLHDMKSNTPQNLSGSIEADFFDIDFQCQINHTFFTEETEVYANGVIYSDVSWTAKPRNLNTYIIEETLKRNNVTEWYEDSLSAWHETVLIQWIREAIDSLPFPISPY